MKESKIRILILVLIILSIFSFLGLHSTLTSGFHFVDNHEVAQITKDVADNNGNIFIVIKNWVRSDLGGRFRPMYMIDNVLVFSTFKNNFTGLHVYHALLISFAVFFIFVSMRNFNYSVFLSISFPLLILLGSQSAIIWRLGPNESIGLWYFSLVLLLISIIKKKEKPHFIIRILFVHFSIFMMLCKESFLLLTPALIYFILDFSSIKACVKSIKKFIPEISILLVLLMISVIFILKNVDTESLGYAGIKGVNGNMYIKAFGTLFIKNFVGLISLLLFLISLYLQIHIKNKEKIYKHIRMLILSLLIIFPQVYLYGKSGIFERYYIPGIIGWVLLMVFSFKQINEYLTSKKSFSNKFLEENFQYFIIIPLVIYKLVGVSAKAEEFTQEGNEVNAVLSFVRLNNDPKNTILFIAEPVTDFERTISFRRYLNGFYGYDKLFTLPVIEPNIINNSNSNLVSGFWWIMGGEQNRFDKIQNKSEINTIICFPYWRNKSDSIIQSKSLEIDKFQKFNIGKEYIVYLKNDQKSNDSLSYYSDKVLPINTNETVYNESSFFPKNMIHKGDSVIITLHPKSEIREPMIAFVILLDQSTPDNILLHNQIYGDKKITFKIIADKNYYKPWLIYRNWGKECDIPECDIDYFIKNGRTIGIPVKE